MKILNPTRAITTQDIERRLMDDQQISPLHVKDMLRKSLQKRAEIEAAIEHCFSDIEALHEDSEAVAEFIDALLDVLYAKRQERKP